MEQLVFIILGVVCVFMGLSHRKGNLSMLHSYHTKRVAEADRLPFGRLVGLGMILVGVALFLKGGFDWLSLSLQAALYATVGTVLLAVGLVVGLGISFYAMIKYNKGIF